MSKNLHRFVFNRARSRLRMVLRDRVRNWGDEAEAELPPTGART